MEDNDDCTNGCLLARCGDGITNSLGVNPSLIEECDDMDSDNFNACTNACANAACGDGFLYALNENCDDGNGDNTDGCPDLAPATPDGRTYCQPARCGDGFTQAGVETCDDGNGVNTDACPDGTGAVCAPAFCGDTYVQTGVEQCDTGGTPTATCDAQCYVLPRRYIEVETNNSTATANTIGTFTRVEGTITLAADVDFFAFTVSEVVHLTATVSNPAGQCTGAYDTFLTLLDQAGAILATNDDINASTNFCSSVNPTANPGARGLEPGRTYYLAVRHFSATGTLNGPYQLDLVFAPNTCGDTFRGGTELCDGVPGCSAACMPVCGDGIVVAPFETCDGVPVPTGCDPVTCTSICGDGTVLPPEECDPPMAGTCSSACRLEYPRELEPNSSLTPPDEPSPLAAPGITGELPAADVDLFTFTLSAVSHVRLETRGLAGPCPAGADTILDLIGADGTTVIGSDDNDGDGNCSFIRPAVDTFARALQPGVYYVRVTARAAVAEYLLTIQITANTCGDGFLAGTEICDDGNPALNDGCEMCAPRCGDGIRVGPETCDGTPLPLGCDPGSCQPVCGDGTVLAPEQCDDSQAPPMDGDGCSALCRFEYASEGTVLNNTTAQADTNPALTMPGITGSVEPETDVDIYRLEITQANTSIRLFTEESQDACPTADTQLRLRSATGTSLAIDTDDGRGNCSYLGAGLGPDGFGNDAAATNMAVGVYYVEVTSELYFGEQFPIPAYTLRVEIIAPGCGNGILNPGEICDDGNQVDGDNCNNMCALNLMLTPEVEPNSDRTDAMVHGPLAAGQNGWSAAINGPTALPTPGAGDQDYFMFTIPAGQTRSVRAEVSDGTTGCPFDSILELRSATNTVLVTDLDDGIGNCSLIDGVVDGPAQNLGEGTYYLVVRHNSATSTVTAPYVLSLNLIAPGCGNRILEGGEACDDGNMNTGDGCDACAFEPGWGAETEPNGACASAVDGTDNQCTAPEIDAGRASANILTFNALGVARVDGAITPTGDDDWYAVDVVTPGPLVLQTAVPGSTTCGGIDTTIELFTALGVAPLVEDDDDSFNFCSFIGPGPAPEGTTTGFDAAVANLAVGRYYVRVHAWSATGTIAAYRLTVTRSP